MKINLIYKETKQPWYTYDTVSKISSFTDERINATMLKTGIPYTKDGQQSWVKLDDKNFYQAYKEYVDEEGLESQGFAWFRERPEFESGIAGAEAAQLE